MSNVECRMIPANLPKWSGRGLWIPAAMQSIMVEHCQAHWPKEACGVLAGYQIAERPGEVVAVHAMRNVEDSPIGYSMDPGEQLQVEKRMRQAGHILLGVYHSHTASDAFPSSVDTHLAISPDLSYVLVSLKDRQHPVIKTYRIDEGKIYEEDLWLEQPPSNHTGQPGLRPL